MHPQKRPMLKMKFQRNCSLGSLHVICIMKTKYTSQSSVPCIATVKIMYPVKCIWKWRHFDMAMYPYSPNATANKQTHNLGWSSLQLFVQKPRKMTILLRGHSLSVFQLHLIAETINQTGLRWMIENKNCAVFFCCLKWTSELLRNWKDQWWQW